MHQRKYAFGLVFEIRLREEKSASTPIETNIKLTIKEYDDHVYPTDHSNTDSLANHGY